MAARSQLQRFVDDGVADDQLISMIAESSYKIAEDVANGDGVVDPLRLSEERNRAIIHYKYLLERFQAGQATAGSDIYRKAAYYLGACYLLEPDSDPVKALVAFLRARQLFSEHQLEPELVLAIARCYAQLQEDANLIEELHHVLNVTGEFESAGGGHNAVSALMGSLKGDLNSYSDTIRAQVLFYIAQAHFRASRRRPEQRQDHLEKALRDYGRVLTAAQNSPLQAAARLGLGRAALALGDE